jgi:signal transduction histidine kinase
MHKRHLVRSFTVILLPGILLVAGLAAVLTALHVNAHRESVRFESSHAVDDQQAIIAQLCRNITADVLTVASQHEVETFATGDTPARRHALSNELAEFVTHKRIYDQVRYIAADGWEIVRVNHRDGRTTIVPDGELQDKQHRYYVTETMALRPGEIFASPLDLNIERGEIEQPRRPMIRVGTPVYADGGRAFGMVIVNYSAADLLGPLDRIGENARGRFFLLNSGGYYLRSPDPADEFGFMYADRQDRTFGHHYPEAWRAVARQDEGFVETAAGYLAYTTIRPFADTADPVVSACDLDGRRAVTAPVDAYRWKLVAFTPRAAIEADLRGFLGRLTPPAILILLLYAVGSWRLAVAIQRRKNAEQALVAANAELEHRVEVRTAELMRTSAALNQEIRERIEAVIARQEIEQELESTEGLRALGAVTAGIAHDFNNILVPVRGFAELAMQNLPPVGPVRRNLDEIVLATDRGQELVEQVMTFSGRHGLNVTDVDMGALVREVGAQLSAAAGEGITVTVDAPAGGPVIRADASGLHRGLMNLGRNAMQAIGMRSGDVALTLAVVQPGGDLHAGGVRVTVTDNGPGIAPDILDRIFEPYFTTKADVKGTGLGLATTRKMVAQHGGTLTVASTVGEGTTFTMTLPGEAPPPGD